MKILKIVRKIEKLTQAELALKLGVTKSYISQLENNKKSASIDFLIKLCDELSYHPCVFLCRRFKTQFPACLNCQAKFIKNFNDEDSTELIKVIKKNKRFFLDLHQEKEVGNNLKGVYDENCNLR